METQTGTSADALTFLRELEESPYKFDFFMALRRLECLHTDKPKFGTGARPADEPVRLGQEPSLAFAQSALTEFRAGDKHKTHQLNQLFFGLFGPNGPLPIHLTEFARGRERHEDDSTFRKFADVFHHRLLMLFYRAWANSQPTTSLDRPQSRRFDNYVGSMLGLGAAEFQGRDSVPDETKLHLAGRFAQQSKSAEGLLAVLEEYFEFEFQVYEFKGEWLRLAVKDWMRLGTMGCATTLGRDTVIGQSVWNCQHKFRIICGPLRLAQFLRLLPGRPSLTRLRDLVRNYVGFGLDWDVNLVLDGADVPRLRLGESGHLGWTTWLGDRKSHTNADDVVIRPNIAELKASGPVLGESQIN